MPTKTSQRPTPVLLFEIQAWVLGVPSCLLNQTTPVFKSIYQIMRVAHLHSKSSIPSFFGGYCFLFLCFTIFSLMIQPSECLGAQAASGVGALDTSRSGGSSGMISMNELLSTCVDACSRGCAEIRKVQNERESGGSGPNNSNSEQAFSILKDANDPKSALTQADGAAQAAILDSLIAEWGSGLRIVGEEEEEDTPKSSTLDSPSNSKLRRDLCIDLLQQQGATADASASEGSDNGGIADMVKLSDVTVFVDPLDGTREFVESRLSNCQSLVGITINNKPVAGVQGVPFPDGTLETDPIFVYAQVGVGHGIHGGSTSGAAPPASNDYSSVTPPLLGSGDSTHPVMTKCRQLASPCTNVLYGGAGNKILAVAAGHLDCSIALKYGGPWDVCAPQAVLEAMGGRITTLTGEHIRETYQGDGSPNAYCKLGFIVTGANSVTDHDQLIASLRDSSEMQEYFKTIDLS